MSRDAENGGRLAVLRVKRTGVFAGNHSQSPGNHDSTSSRTRAELTRCRYSPERVIPYLYVDAQILTVSIHTIMAR